MSLKWIAAGCVLLAAGINLAIFATGHMHAHRAQPTWVVVTSWIFAVACYALTAVLVVVLRRRWRSRQLGRHTWTLAQASTDAS